jgi:hypothetical protein
MKCIVKKSFLLIGVFIFSCKAFADNENYDVKRVGVHSERGWVYVEVDRRPNGYDCGDTPIEFVWELSNPAAKPIMAVALTAQTRGKQVRIRFDSGDCINGYPTGVWLALRSQ